MTTTSGEVEITMAVISCRRVAAPARFGLRFKKPSGWAFSTARPGRRALAARLSRQPWGHLPPGIAVRALPNSRFQPGISGREPGADQRDNREAEEQERVLRVADRQVDDGDDDEHQGTGKGGNRERPDAEGNFGFGQRRTLAPPIRSTSNPDLWRTQMRPP